MFGIPILIVITIFLVILVYSIVRFLTTITTSKKPVEESLYDVPYKESFNEYEIEQAKLPAAVPPMAETYTPESVPADIRPTVQNAEKMPDVVGQSEEELRSPEPLQEATSQKVEPIPEVSDPYQNNENVALFGSNLRHPESMIVKADNNPSSMKNAVDSGLASTGAKDSPFESELAQNGGEFMSGIFAYDSVSSSEYFSEIK